MEEQRPLIGMDFISPYEMSNPRNCKLRIIAMSFVAKPLARNDRFVFENFKMELEHWFCNQGNFC
jgi:hypothetical protein